MHTYACMGSYATHGRVAMDRIAGSGLVRGSYGRFRIGYVPRVGIAATLAISQLFARIGYTP